MIENLQITYRIRYDDFYPVVRNPRKNRTQQVYIRIIHNGKPAYLKTYKLIHASNVSSAGTLKDNFVNHYIQQFYDHKRVSNIAGWLESHVE